MPNSATTQQFDWMILQSGQLPLRPDGTVNRAAEHRCTVTLVWPHNAELEPENSVLADPCFSEKGYDRATAHLMTQNMSLNNVGHIFVTHLHADHMLHLPYNAPAPRFRPLRPETRGPLAAIERVPLPGHHADLQALAFEDGSARAVWLVSDAVLDEDWLHAWGYYHPNWYSPAQIVETWRSVARVIAGADVIVPGHGAPITVDAALVAALLESFPHAEHADDCPDVADTLRARLGSLGGERT